ncbi:hypothetical protein D5086_010876 [Populus alba]|uniref:Uncharacterized protein n=1 Tax=Populus alba TaxID=43335 RepID=A0ACC4CBR5_POPAL
MRWNSIKQHNSGADRRGNTVRMADGMSDLILKSLLMKTQMAGEDDYDFSSASQGIRSYWASSIPITWGSSENVEQIMRSFLWSGRYEHYQGLSGLGSRSNLLQGVFRNFWTIKAQEAALWALGKDSKAQILSEFGR